jgi:hypothetical protein
MATLRRRFRCPQRQIFSDANHSTLTSAPGLNAGAHDWASPRRIMVLLIDPALLIRRLMADLLGALAPDLDVRTAPSFVSGRNESAPDVIVLSGFCGREGRTDIGAEAAMARHVFPCTPVLVVCSCASLGATPARHPGRTLLTGAGAEELVAAIRNPVTH